jgi:cellulose synthase/poly-beta-1,6-N-acetylglucosamine synthase-like glycosyltransferase
MLSVVIPARNAAPQLQALLAALVPAAVDGLVREVIVVGAGSTDETADICEDAGAELVASFAEAAKRARYDRVLALPVDIRLRAGWETTIGAHLARGGKAAILRGEREGWFKAVTAGALTTREALAAAEDLTVLKRKSGGARL